MQLKTKAFLHASGTSKKAFLSEWQQSVAVQPRWNLRSTILWSLSRALTKSNDKCSLKQMPFLHSPGKSKKVSYCEGHFVVTRGRNCSLANLLIVFETKPCLRNSCRYSHEIHNELQQTKQTSDINPTRGKCSFLIRRTYQKRHIVLDAGKE